MERFNHQQNILAKLNIEIYFLKRLFNLVKDDYSPELDVVGSDSL